jgi:hypothetical protein
MIFSNDLCPDVGMVIHAFVVAPFKVQHTIPSRRLVAARGFLDIADHEAVATF